jgi:hypothetical protein
MKPLLRFLPSFCALALAVALAQTGPAGHWEGGFQLPDREMKVALDLAKDAKDAWIGTFSQSDGVHGLPLTDIKVDGKSARFRLGIGGANAPDFDCALQSAEAMNCTLSGPGGSVSGAMKRTGEAKIELAKPSTAVSKELEGDWDGSVSTPNGSLRIVVHFKNQPDGTTVATMDSPDQNAAGLPLSDVSQKGTAVEFQLRLVGGSFKGNLNKEGTELAGDWSQGGGTVPLTMKKTK